MKWMLMPFKRYAQFSGRSRRKEFWMFTLLNLLVYAVIVGAVVAVGGAGRAANAAGQVSVLEMYSMMFRGVGVLAIIWALITLIPSIAVTVRRLHDRDMSGWWYPVFVVASLVPFVGLVAPFVIIVVLALDGTRGPNRFGPDPKDDGQIDTFN